MASLKTRLLWRSERANEESNRKLSQSASDITARKELDLEEDLCSQGIMGSRALSHDSIFLADEDSSDEDPVLSQENVHSKIKALQMKLQQQKLHFGPPPLVVPVRRPEDSRSRSEETRLSHSPPRASAMDIQASPAKSWSPVRPLSPIYKPASIRSLPPSPSKPLPAVSRSTSAADAGLDLSSPPQTSQCLDTSAARHRISVKPRNQRASTQRRRPTPDSQSSLESVNNVSILPKLRTDEAAPVEDHPVAAYIKPAEAEFPVQPKVPDISSSSVFQKDHGVSGRTFSSISALRVKPHGDGTVAGRPHSSFISSEMIRDLEKLHDDRRKTQYKPEASDTKFTSLEQLSSGTSPGSGHDSLLIQGAAESRGLQRNFAGSFHFSTTRSAERPRSGSFVGVFAPTGARQKTDETEQQMRDNDNRKDFNARVGRIRAEETQRRAVDMLWERTDSLKNVEPGTGTKKPTTDAVGSQVQEHKRNQEKMERTSEEHQDGEGRNVFGFKLRSTNQSVRLWSNLSSHQTSEEESREATKQGEKEPTELKRAPSFSDITDAPLYGIVSAAKHPPAAAAPPPLMPSAAKEASVVAYQDQPPQPAAPEASWMSLAMEKTRSLQQLFTSRFPRDNVSNQPSPETILSVGQPQKMSHMGPSKTSKDPPFQTRTSQSPPEDLCWTSAAHSVPQPSHFSQGSYSWSPPKSFPSVQQQTAWTSGPNSGSPFKSTTLLVAKVSSSTPATSAVSWDLPPPVYDREATSFQGRALGRTGSVSERAAFLERTVERTVERTSSVYTKGVEPKRAPPSDEPLVSFKRIQIIESKPEERLHAESSPSRVPGRPREEKWLRKSSASASLPSAPESGQPSWMELAKRKSMAWSDKSMD
ncbi:capping protein-inhibiting regulator of actin dynamics [Synchiropus splendidus]|uniref:capping protein-inhibiting regulator of actin dynamics n=1 Tax=Synchiropus splendidus TaxID=270530 RepID=UPI00237D4209|nr:capping protein-inhibiting regulator of actin dynamics [Synchiropus splendidus]